VPLVIGTSAALQGVELDNPTVGCSNEGCDLRLSQHMTAIDLVLDGRHLQRVTIAGLYVAEEPLHRV
jgi:hypothetical protein